MELDEAQLQRLNELKKYHKFDEILVNIDHNNWLISIFTKVLLLSTPFVSAFIVAVPIPHEKLHFISYVSAGLSMGLIDLGLAANIVRLKMISKSLRKEIKEFN